MLVMAFVMACKNANLKLVVDFYLIFIYTKLIPLRLGISHLAMADIEAEDVPGEDTGGGAAGGSASAAKRFEVKKWNAVRRRPCPCCGLFCLGLFLRLVVLKARRAKAEAECAAA